MTTRSTSKSAFGSLVFVALSALSALLATGCGVGDDQRAGSAAVADVAFRPFDSTSGRPRTARPLPARARARLAAAPQADPNRVHLQFRVAMGRPGSAEAAVIGGPGRPTGAALTFPAVHLLDADDLYDAAGGFEIVGVWTWEMDGSRSRGASESAMSEHASAALESALNHNFANDSVPDAGPVLASRITLRLVDTLTDLRDSESGLLAAPTRRSVHSHLSVGLGATGALAAIMDHALAETMPASIDASRDGLPPGLDEIAIFSLGGRSSVRRIRTTPDSARHSQEIAVIGNTGEAAETAEAARPWQRHHPIDGE